MGCSVDVQDFHELAIPHLYTSVIAPGLPRFLSDLDNPIASLEHKITSKRKRLEKVQTLCFSPLDLPFTIVWDMSDLIQGAVDWESLGETDTHRRSRFTVEAQTFYREIMAVMERILPGPKSTPKTQPINFPSLDNITINARDFQGWLHEVGVPSHRARVLPQQHEAVRLNLTRLFISWNPRIICTDVSWSPYVPFPGEVLPMEKLQSLIFHHLYPLGSIPLGIGLGVLNRHICNPDFNYGLFPPNEELQVADLGSGAYLVDLLKGLREVAGKEGEELFLNTKLDLAGFCTLPEVAMTWGSLFGGKGKYVTSEDLRVFERGVKKERSVMVDSLATLREDLDEKWHKILSITEWGRMPECEACGWSYRKV